MKKVKPNFVMEERNWHVLYVSDNCKSVLKEECTVEYKELCETKRNVRKQCKDSYKMICSYVDSKNCEPSKKCVKGSKRECKTEYKEVCRLEKTQDRFSALFKRQVRKCDLVPMKICRKQKCPKNKIISCVNGQQKVCRRKPMKKCKKAQVSENNCRKIPIRKCQQLPKTIC